MHNCMTVKVRGYCAGLLWMTMLVCAAPIVRAAAIDQFFDAFADDWVRSNPDLATSSRYFSGDEQNKLERQLTPQTRAWQLDRIRRAERGLDELRKFNRSSFTKIQRVSADLMQWQLDAVVRQGVYLDYEFPLDQFQGANVNLVETLTLRHPLQTLRDADNYLARLKLVAPRMNEALEDAKRLIQKKMVPPRFILQATIASMRTFSDAPAEQNPLVTAYAQKLEGIKDLDAKQREQLRARAAQLVSAEVYPAWRRALASLESALPISTDDAGLWRYADGAKVYANALRRFTTTSLGAEEIHQIGLQQVTRIDGKMDAILKRIGRTEGSVRERMGKLEIDLRYSDPTSEASRAQIMKDIDGLIRDAIVRSEPMFERTPKAPVIAQPFPKFREAAAAANYNRAPLDGSRPAIYQMPLRVSRMTKLGLRTLVYHETVPGHHFQIGLEQENTALPRFRQARALGGISALSEGWALYAERLAVESGWYDNDPQGELGQLNAELFRARRLVVDTGLHAKRWTRQQAIDYGIEPSEVERYVVNPGQACSYMIGQLKILEMRDYARQQLGDKFSPKGFHSVVLDTGTAPLELLQREVESYVQLAKSR